MPAQPTEEITTEVAQQQQFIDATQFQVMSESDIPKLADVTENGMDISHFFERPLLVRSSEWDDGVDFFETMQPWLEYFSHDTIAPKLLGFSRLTCNLRVEIRVNGSPFRFSEILASYRPLFSIRKLDSTGSRTYSLSDYSGGYLPEDGVQFNTLSVNPTGSTDFTLMARSQRQCAYINISRSEGCILELPFIHPFDCLRVNSMMGTFAADSNTLFGQELASMGTLTLESLAKLRNMQTASTTGVTIDYFISAYNVKAWLSSGVATVTPQGMELKPSKIASSVASVASIFRNVPVIAPYATLTEFLANTGSSILQFFGYTPRPDVTLPQLITGYSYPVESSVTFPKKVRNLGLDHNNNVVVDPAVIGGPSEDLLSIASLAARTSLLCRTWFGSSLGVGDSIFFLPVSPLQYNSQLLSGSTMISQRRIQMIPSSIAAMNFRMWRGTMVVRFQAITTQHHRGRLRVTWEPEIGSSNTLAAGSFATYEGYQQMINWDLSSSDALTVKVGFGARKGRLSIPRFGVPGLTDATYATNAESTASTAVSPTITLTNYEDYFNGFLKLSVLTRLQAPDVSYPIPIMVYVSFEDLELYDPVDNGPGLNFFHESAAYAAAIPNSTNLYYGTTFSCEDIENAMLRKLAEEGAYPQGAEVVFQPTTRTNDSVHEGEKVGSLRALLMRDTFYDTLHFEIQRAATSINDSGSPGFYHHYYQIPPTVISAILPMYPHPYGTSSPLRSTSMTPNVTNPAYTQNYTTGAGLYCPSLARTNLFPILRECFVGFRGSYNWKFFPITENGAEIKSMAASRANYYHSAYGCMVPKPHPGLTSPFTTKLPATKDSALYFSDQRFASVYSMVFDSGDTATPDFTIRNAMQNVQTKLANFRRGLNSFLGSFAAGGLIVDTREQRTLGIRIPFFSTVKFHPGSVTGWLNSNSNSELSQNIRLGFVVEAKPKSMCAVPIGSTGSTISTMHSDPPRPSVSVAVTCSAGDDISFGHFVNVPTLYFASATLFTNPNQAGS